MIHQVMLTTAIAGLTAIAVNSLEIDQIKKPLHAIPAHHEQTVAMMEELGYSAAPAIRADWENRKPLITTLIGKVSALLDGDDSCVFDGTGVPPLGDALSPARFGLGVSPDSSQLGGTPAAEPETPAELPPTPF